MIGSVDAVYDNGVFRPEMPVQLPQGTRVTLTFDIQDSQRRLRQEAYQRFLKACQESNVDSGGLILSRDELHERR
jgi:predicted DNA-binding antitoxin AbrB/MazE fold protein